MEINWMSWVRNYLDRQKYGTAEVAAGIGVPIGRVGDWIKRGTFLPLTNAMPGTGRSREFPLADVYRLALVAALADEDGTFAMPVARAVQIVDWACGLRAEVFTGLPDNDPRSVSAADIVALSRNELLSGRTFRDVPWGSDALFLVGGWIERVEPPERHLAGAFVSEEHILSGLPNPNSRPRNRIVLDVTPILTQVARNLLDAKGLAELAPDHADFLLEMLDKKGSI